MVSGLVTLSSWNSNHSGMLARWLVKRQLELESRPELTKAPLTPSSSLRAWMSSATFLSVAKLVMSEAE